MITTPTIMISHRYGGSPLQMAHAKQLRTYLTREWPGAAWIAPWIDWAEAVGHEVEADPAERAAWFAKSVRVARQCDGVLVYGKISPGVAQEFMAARSVAAVRHMHELEAIHVMTFTSRRPGVSWDLHRFGGRLK